MENINFIENGDYLVKYKLENVVFYDKNKEIIDEIIDSISNLIRYWVFKSNNKRYDVKEYENKKNYVIELFTNIINSIELNESCYGDCIKYFQILKKLYYEGAASYSYNIPMASIYYRSVEKVIDELTICTLRTIGEKQEQCYKHREEIRSISLSNLAHDLRTPINIVLCSNQMLNANKERRQGNIKYGDIIKHNCFRLLKMIDNIIDMAKEDGGNLSLNSSNIDIIELFDSLVDSIKDTIELKGINFIYNCKLKSKIMYVDSEKIERIVLNLISNGVKFSNVGGTIKLTIEEEKEYLKISIKDTGCGISKEEQNNIFNRYYQINSEDSAKGNGIGLSLVKAFTSLHNGKIKLISELGKGSDFIVYLPDIIDKNSEIIKYDKYFDNKDQIINKEFSDI